MRNFRSCIMTGLLMLLLLMAGCYFLNCYKAYIAHKEKKTVLVQKIGWLSQLKSEREQQLKNILRINNFVNNAKLLGLEQNKWEIYNVDLEDAVSFAQMKAILKQCSNSNSHYFRPVSFHIKSLKAAGNDGEASGKTFENETGDILMKLKGSFVAKNYGVLKH